LLLVLGRAAILGFVSQRAEAIRVPGDVEAGTCSCPTSATFMGAPIPALPVAWSANCYPESSSCQDWGLRCVFRGNRMVKDSEFGFPV